MSEQPSLAQILEAIHDLNGQGQANFREIGNLSRQQDEIVQNLEAQKMSNAELRAEFDSFRQGSVPASNHTPVSASKPPVSSPGPSSATKKGKIPDPAPFSGDRDDLPR